MGRVHSFCDIRSWLLRAFEEKPGCWPDDNVQQRLLGYRWQLYEKNAPPDHNFLPSYAASRHQYVETEPEQSPGKTMLPQG